MTNKIDLILHPIRMRIITTISGRNMTTQQLAMELEDVPQATLYRHINTLIKGQILTVVEQKQIRGTVEKTYILNPQMNLNLTEDEIQNATKDDHMRYFTTFLATVMSEYSRYLQSTDQLNMTEDGVGYHTVPLYMNDHDVQEFSTKLQELLMTYTQPTAGEQRRLFSFVIMPSDKKEGE